MPGGLIRGFLKAVATEYDRAKAEQHAREQYGQTQPNNGPQSVSPQQAPPPYTQSQQQASQYPTKEPAVNVAEISPSAPEALSGARPTTQKPQPRNKPSCAPLETIVGGQGYITSAVPDMDVCPACFAKYISDTPFASIFRPMAYTSSLEHFCDMSTRAIRDRWLDMCARAAGTDSSTQQAYLQRFGKAHGEINAEITQLFTQIQALKQEIQNESALQNYQRQTGMMQISHNMSMNSIGAFNTSSVRMKDHILSSAGHKRLAEAGQMDMSIRMKVSQHDQLLGRFKQLTGIE